MTRHSPGWLARLTQTPGFHPTWIVLAVGTTVVVAALVLIPAELLAPPDSPASPAVSPPQNATPLAAPPPAPPPAVLRPAVFHPPAESDMPSGEFGRMVQLGHDLFVDTQTHARAYVGNGLNCANCHLDAGRKADSAPLWGAYPMYPAYREKNQQVNTYEDRLRDCFRFSMNGKAPPPGSPELVALTSYSYWLATGAPVGVKLAGRGYPALTEPSTPPDATRGSQVYAQHCAACHGASGEGTRANGRYTFPPLWGPDSFNGGAGMARVATAAAFIHANMPLGQGGTLSAQAAWDVAQFINSHSRPPDPRTAPPRHAS